MGVVLGIDFGTKRIGLAVSDAGRTFVFSRPTLERRGAAQDLEHLAQLCREERVELVALGLPLNADGSEGEMCRAVRSFRERLARHCALPVCLVDERYSSLEADERLREAHPKDTRKRRALRDQAAAALILRSFLDEGAYEGPEDGRVAPGERPS